MGARNSRSRISPGWGLRRLVVVDDLDILGSSVDPAEADAPLIVDADRMLALAFKASSRLPGGILRSSSRPETLSSRSFRSAASWRSEGKRRLRRPAHILSVSRSAKLRITIITYNVMGIGSSQGLRLCRFTGRKGASFPSDHPMPHLDQVLADVDKDLDNSLQRLFQWLRIPSISTDPAYAKDCRRAAEWLKGDLEAMGFEASLRDTPGHPVVLAHAPKPGAPHVLFYGHYDVQPVDPVDLWETPPFEPRMATLKDGRKVISARGACDDKGQVMTFIEACRAWKAVAGALPVGITMMIEGEEESGSPNLPAFVAANREELKADVALVCDTGMWDQGTPAITASLRGLAYFEVVVRCADRDLHSGLFGGAARNPIHVLARIVADLHDADGRIAVPHFYDGVQDLPPEVLEQWRRLNLTPEEFLGQVGLKVSAGEKGQLLVEQIQS